MNTNQVSHKHRLLNIIGYFLLAGAILLGMLQYRTVQLSIQHAYDLDQSPIEYSDWVPTKTEYTPGDLMEFSYTREVKPQPDNEGVFTLSAVVFENTTTGEVFRGASMFKKIKPNGKEQLKTVRRLPPECTPGQYVMQGLASAQTSRLSKTIGFVSEPFTVKAKPVTEPSKP